MTEAATRIDQIRRASVADEKRYLASLPDEIRGLKESLGTARWNEQHFAAKRDEAAAALSSLNDSNSTPGGREYERDLLYRAYADARAARCRRESL